MYYSFLKISWRNYIRGKAFSIINTLGLAIGMAGAILILLWLVNEISFDKFHRNKDNLYEVYGLTRVDEHPYAIPMVPQPLGPVLEVDFPEVESQTRVKDMDRLLLTANNKSFSGILGSVVDPSFLQIFSFPLVHGNTNEQLKNVYSITITENLAKKLFGDENAIGKLIKIDSIDHFTVTGILKDLPPNTRFNFQYLLPFSYFKKLGQGYVNDSWISNNTPTFVQLKPNVNLHAFESKIANLSRENSGRADIWTHFLFPLKDWHLFNEFENGKPVGGRIEKVRVFGIIAIFILLIACINFMNLSTARSEKRAKEVGIRKVTGASKGLLMGQFLAEAFMAAIISGLLALLIVQFALPSFNTLIDSRLSIPYGSFYFWVSALSFIAFTSLLAGSYPAFYLSSFKPVSIFRKQFKKANATLSPRKMLVVTQFTFAVILIISTIVVRNQIRYAQDRDKGYSNKDLIHVDFVGNIENNYELIKHELINSGAASSITKNMIDISHGGARSWGLRWPNEIPKDTNTAILLYSSDADWVKTAGLTLTGGRDIDIYNYPADSFSVVLNETAVRLMGFKEPIGQTIFMRPKNTPMRVVGVVKDYITGSPYEDVSPTVIQGAGAWFNTMHIKLNPAHATADNLTRIEQVFRKYNSAYPFDYRFVDQEYARQFNDEQRTKTMAGLFAGLAIVISCLGLFGLSAYVAESRVKEIGVRKVLGASVASIARLLSMDFVKLVLISVFIAIPAAWYAMNKWLQGYTYRIHITFTIFLLSGLLAVIIAVVTVGFQSIKAAISNPIKSLRTE